jgi:hypothetical protein
MRIGSFHVGASVTANCYRSAGALHGDLFLGMPVHVHEDSQQYHEDPSAHDCPHAIHCGSFTAVWNEVRDPSDPHWELNRPGFRGGPLG